MPLGSGPPALRALLGYVSPQSWPLLLAPRTAGRKHSSRRFLLMTLETLSEVEGSVTPACGEAEEGRTCRSRRARGFGQEWLPELLRSPVAEIDPELKAA